MAPLLERELLLEALDDALAETASTGSLALVAGEAGIGKTALVRAFAERGARAGARVVWSRCDDLTVPRALGAVHDLARDGSPVLADALRSDRRADALEAVRTELARVAPTVWIVEDVHWADGATLDVLSYLSRRLEGLGALVVLTFRDDELAADHPLRRVLGAIPPGAARRLHVPRLSLTAVEELAGAPASDLFAATGGNAFFVTEAIASGGLLPPPSVRDAVLARAARLTPQARAALDLVAVVPGGAELWLVRDAGSAEGLAECEELGLLGVDEGTVRFHHELARHVVEEALPGGRRAALHERVLDALERWNVDPARLVHHALEAGDADRTVALSLTAARDAAAARAHAEAAAHYARLLEHEALLDADTLATVLEGLAEEGYQASQPEAAIAACERAIELRRGQGHPLRLGADLRHLARLQWWARGDPASAVVAVDEAVAILEPLGPGHELAMAYAHRSQLLMLAQRDAEAIAVGERAIELARALGDDAALVHAITTVGTSALRDIDASRGYALLEEAVRLGVECGYDEQACRAAANVAWDACDKQQLALADELSARALALADAREQRTFTLYGLAAHTRVDLALGRWDAVTAAAEELLAQPDLPIVARMPAVCSLAAVAVRRGARHAEQLVAEAWGPAHASGELQRLRPAACAWAELAWLREEPAEVERVTREAYALALEVGHAWDVGELAAWRWRAGVAVDPPPRQAVPHRLLIEGDAPAAAARWLALGDRHQAALCLVDAGGPAHLRQALELLDELGAEAVARRVRRRLRALGEVRVPRGPRPSTRANPAGLTARQLEILALLADGATNAAIARQLFLTPKTVEHHVGAVLAKLAVGSRAEAAARARTLGLLQPGGAASPTPGRATDGAAGPRS